MNTTTPDVKTTTQGEWKEDSNIAIVGGVLAFAFICALMAYFINRVVASRTDPCKRYERPVQIWSVQQPLGQHIPQNASLPPNSVYAYDQ